LKIRGLAGQIGRPVIRGKIHRHLLLIARGQADQAPLEIRQHAALAEHDRDVLALAAGKRHTVDRPFEIHGHPVPARGRARHRRELGLLLAQALDHGVHVALGNLGRGTVDFQRIDGLERDVG